MKTTLTLAVAVACAMLLQPAMAQTARPPDAVSGASAARPAGAAAPATAAAEAARPEADTKRDTLRKPAEMVKFAGIKPGSKVVDFMPGSGYFTRVFSEAVGPKGVVYAVVPEEMLKRRATAADGIKAIAAEPAFGNVKVLVQPAGAFAPPEPVDVVWTSQNYHDVHTASFGLGNVADLNKAAFRALKAGGMYIVLDHAAAPGASIEDSAKLHRIDPAMVKQEVTAAGFVFDGEDSSLRNPDDPHTAGVFDPSVRGKTDQFIYRFRKP
ncbi:Ubiquinone/menaquinone biosynthesis C-methyltransferase UbiE [Gammaproteobacteria bacterium]|nr:class I SAM-dependent methyltransferase [Gammaproteobacteria bacterium]CAG0942351.1 Ubiquinone/menaquinone biosynthesis C-methyltransferase UbiE [Gammaproteobacteria bacterium]